MKRMMIPLLPIVVICFLTSSMAVSCRESKQVDHTDFFGVNLDENGNQVEKLHNLILAGEVRLNGKVLKECADHIGTDYCLTEGQMVSIEIESGDVEYVSSIKDSLNLSYSERFTSTDHFMSKQWLQNDSGENHFEYIDLYQYRNYSIGVQYRIISPTCDETNITSAEVRVGLSLSNENTEELREALIEAYKSQDWEKVVSYGMTMEENGDSIGDLTIAYAEGLCALEMYEKARALVSNRIESHSNDRIDYLYRTMGVICYLEGKKDEALAYHKKAIEINPYYARVFIFMAEIYSDKGEKEKAVDNYLKATRLFYNNELYDESEYYSKQILEIDNNNIDAYIFLAATYYMKKMASEYKLILDKSKQLGGISAMKRIDELINNIK